MGMDVFGNAPSAPEGKYFRNNVWHWRPLAIYIEQVAPKIYAKCKGWHYNDGDGLDKANALALAAILEEEVKSGRTLVHEKRWAGEQELLPDEDCGICGGTGKRQTPPKVGPGDQPCNGCGGHGRVRPHRTFYPFDVKNVEAFIVFLKACGGFRIC